MSTSMYPCDPSSLLFIHASAVHTDNGALIFLGPSGAGKSTICNLLADSARPLVDDMAILMLNTKGKWVVADMFISSRDKPRFKELDGSLEGPIPRAIFRIYQAAELHLEPIHPLETCRHLVEASSWPQDYTAKMKQIAFTSLAAIARSVPGYHLSFALSTETAKVLQETR